MGTGPHRRPRSGLVRRVPRDMEVDAVSEHAERLRELATYFGDSDSMTIAQETFAEQTRETLEYAARRIEELETALTEAMS